MMLRPTLDSELSGWDLDCHHTAPQLHLTRSSHGVISYTYPSLYHLLIKANVYTIMDFMSDMGGIFGAFGSIFLLITIGLNYFGSYQFLMAELFYSKNDTQKPVNNV